MIVLPILPGLYFLVSILVALLEQIEFEDRHREAMIAGYRAQFESRRIAPEDINRRRSTGGGEVRLQGEGGYGQRVAQGNSPIGDNRRASMPIISNQAAGSGASTSNRATMDLETSQLRAGQINPPRAGAAPSATRATTAPFTAGGDFKPTAEAKPTVASLTPATAGIVKAKTAHDNTGRAILASAGPPRGAVIAAAATEGAAAVGEAGETAPLVTNTADGTVANETKD